MRLEIYSLLLLFVFACATTEPLPKERVSNDPRVANLQRAAALPWADGGRCVVQEASNTWPVLVERCFHALDHERIQFKDPTGRCSVASTGAAALGVGICILIAPEIVVGAVIITGAVVVAIAIKEALDDYERSASRERGKPARPSQPKKQEPSPSRKTQPQGSGPVDFFPPVPPETAEQERRPECRPVPVPHAGKDDPHNECADKFPPNRYPGMDVLVGGARFDALQAGVRVLWEIKTHQFDTYNVFIQDREIEKEYEQVRKERSAAVACGYGFVVGVSTQAHKDALIARDPSLDVVVTGCKR